MSCFADNIECLRDWCKRRFDGMGEQLDGFFKEVRIQSAALNSSLSASSETCSPVCVVVQGGYNPDMETFV